MNGFHHLDRLPAAVYGFAVGDALGVPYEFRDRDTFHCDRAVSCSAV